MSSAKIIAKNTGFLFSTGILDKLFSFLLVIIITRYLGSIGYGKYSFAFAFISLFIIFSHLGLTTYTFREIAKDKSKTKKLIDNVFSLRLITLVVAYFTITIVSLNLPKTREIMLLLFLVMLHEVFAEFNKLIGVVFKAYEKNEFNLYSTIIDKGLALLFGAYVLINGYGLTTFLYALILSKIISFSFYYTICYKKIVKIFFEFNFKLWKTLIKNSIPFWFTTVFRFIYYNIDKVMLAQMKNYAVTGWYSAASTLVIALTFIPMVIINATFPAMSRFHHTNSKELLKLLYKKSVYYLISIAVPISIGISLLAPRLILFIYKEQFIQSGIALRILSLSLIFIFVNYILGYLLNSINKQHLFTISTGVCAISNVTINFILIPKFSYIGAAIATVMTHLINFCLLYYFAAKNNYSLNLIKISYKPLIAGALMGTLVMYIKSLPIIYIIPIAAAFYFIVLSTIKGFGKEEISLIKSFFPKKL